MYFNFRHSVYLTIALLSVLFLTNCQDGRNGENEEASHFQKTEESLSKSLDLKGVSRAHLISPAEEDLSNWNAFISLKVEMEKFETYSLRDVIENSSNIIQSISSVNDSIPEKFDIPPIQSRLNVLVTKGEILNQYLNYQKTDTVQIQHMGKDLYQAYENLEIQFNEVYLQDYFQFDFDMDREQDSIQEAKKEEKH